MGSTIASDDDIFGVLLGENSLSAGNPLIQAITDKINADRENIDIDGLVDHVIGAEMKMAAQPSSEKSDAKTLLSSVNIDDILDELHNK